MRYLVRLLAAVAAAIICLSPLALATAAHADGPDPGLDNIRAEVAAPSQDSSGYSRNGGVTVTVPDQGAARNGGVLAPEPTPAPPATADTGVDAATITFLALLGAVVVGTGVTSAVIVRRQHHHMAHPA